MTIKEQDKQPLELLRPEWLPESEYPFTPRSVDLEGGKVTYVDEGQGPTLLFVHSGLWSFIFRDVITRLRGQFRTITLDFPGSGLSLDVEGVGPLIEESSLLLERFIEALDLSDITLVVHDLGGPVGLGVAARRPELFKALVLSQSFAWDPQGLALRGMLRLMSSAPVRGLSKATNVFARATTTRLGIGRHLSEGGKRAFLGPYRDRERRRRVHELFGNALEIEPYLARVEHGLEARLSDRPVLTIFGERNDPFGFQKRIQEIFGNVQSVVIPKGYHFPMMDDPDLFAESLTNWWNTVVSE